MRRKITKGVTDLPKITSQGGREPVEFEPRALCDSSGLLYHKYEDLGQWCYDTTRSLGLYVGAQSQLCVDSSGHDNNPGGSHYHCHSRIMR